jgi:mannitol-1-/sugar-/sorbitol-6-phosphatase
MELSCAGICFDLFGTLIGDDGSAIEGARAALMLLRASPWAIVTSAPRAAAYALIVRAELPVPPVLVSADDVMRNKPAPEPYALAVERLALDPARALAVEDSASGVASAQGAGIAVIAILRGRPVAGSRAEYAVDRFGKLRFEIAEREIRVRL